MKQLFTIALLSVLLAACGKGIETAVPGLEFHGFGAQTEGYLQAAADDLFSAVALDRHVTVTAVHGESEDGAEGGRACVHCANCWIEVNVDAPTNGSETFLKSLLWHEFGHCVGLEHTDRYGIMNPRNHGFASMWPQDITDYVSAVLSKQKH